MADILKDDVHTYIYALISKEFGSGNNEGKTPADIRESGQGEHRDPQNRSAWSCSLKDSMT